MKTAAFGAALFALIGCGGASTGDAGDAGCADAASPMFIADLVVGSSCTEHVLAVPPSVEIECAFDRASGSYAHITGAGGRWTLGVRGTDSSPREYCVAVLGRGRCDELACGSLVCSSITDRATLYIEFDATTTNDEAFIVLGAGEIQATLCPL